MTSHRLAFCLLALTLILACVPVQSSRGPSGADPLSVADQAYDRGNFRKAAAAYRQFLAENPTSPRYETILALSALSSEQASQYLEAAEAYRQLSSRFPKGTYTRDAILRIADLYLLGGKTQEAYKVAVELQKQVSDSASKGALALSAGRALYASGNYSEALTNFVLASSSAKEPLKSEARKGAEASLSNLTPERLQAVANRYGSNFPGPEANFFLIRQAALDKNQALFYQRAAYFRQNFPRHPWVAKIASLERNPTAAEAQPSSLDYDPKPKLAVLAIARPPAAATAAAQSPGTLSGLKGQAVVVAILPLSSDRISKFGRDVLDGLKLALNPLIDKVTVVGLDSSNDPSKVVKMVYDAAANPNVLAVVGPMTSLEALAAADTCESVSLPMIAISQRLGLTAGRPHVFRIFLTPKHQAESVARYAVRVKGLKRFGILYPDDPYGQAMYGFFRDELARLGVGLTAVDSYGQSPTSYVDAVNRITGGHSVRKASTSFQAPVEFDALYLPDSAPVVTQLLPRIAFNDVTRVIYLGSPLWLTPDLPRSSGRYLKNSIIPEAFSSLSKRREALSFQDVFKTQTGREPDQFAAYGFDAGVALAKVISAGAGTRNEVTRSLATMGPYQGVTGPFSFDSDGDYLVEPVMLTVDERGYSLLDEPSQSR